MSVSPAVQAFRDSELRRCYKTEDLKSLAKRLGFSRYDYVFTRLRSMGITDYQTRNDKNEAVGAFATDALSENEAYLLGYTMADGCVVEARGGISPAMSWECHTDDRVLLDWTYGFLSIGKPPRDVVRTRAMVSPSTGLTGPVKEYRSSIYRVASSTLVERFAKWGVVPRKSCNETYHAFPDQRVHGAFLRGLFDGDGCIATRQRTKGAHMTADISFLGGKGFVTSLRDDLVARLGLTSVAVISNNGRETCWKCNWSSKHDVEALFNHMYPDGKATFPCLYRKLAKFLEWLESEDGKIGRPRVRPLEESGIPESPEGEVVTEPPGAPVNSETSPSQQTSSPSDPVQL